jgi:hypothetical protein
MVLLGRDSAGKREGVNAAPDWLAGCANRCRPQRRDRCDRVLPLSQVFTWRAKS